MIALLRRLFGLCTHDWYFVKKVKLNEFAYEEFEDEEYVISARDFSKLSCTKCKNFRFRKA